MTLALIVLLVALVLGGLGFASQVFWWIAIVVLAFWVLGWFVGQGDASGRRVWYR